MTRSDKARSLPLLRRSTEQKRASPITFSNISSLLGRNESAKRAAVVEQCVDDTRDPAPRHAPTRVTSSVPDPEARAHAWQLVARVQAGDHDAFGEFYELYVDKIFRYILRKVPDRTVTEDLTSETFVRALRAIATVRYQDRDVGGWLVTIARNLVLDHVKSSRYRLEVPTGEISEYGSTMPIPDEVVCTEAVARELRSCLDRLRADQRTCLMLRFMQGLSVAETAVEMGRTEGAVKALQHRAVRRLAQLVPDELR